MGRMREKQNIQNFAEESYGNKEHFYYISGLFTDQNLGLNQYISKMVKICLFNWKAKKSRCLPICHLCLPLSKEAQFKTAVSEVLLGSKYWQLEAISLIMPVTQFRKYTEILTLTVDVISWLPKYFTAFIFIYVIFFKSFMMFLQTTKIIFCYWF